jgi:hypothetical protein
MLIGRFDFAKKIFQKALGSISTAMNDIQSELLACCQQFRLNCPTARGGCANGTVRHKLGKLGHIFYGQQPNCGRI